MSAIQKRLKKMEVRFDEEDFIVVDMGTGTIKAGHSGEDLPRVIMPTVMGEKEIKDLEQGTNNPNNEPIKQKFVHTFGMDAYANRDDYELYHPIQRGIVVDYDKMELILDNIFDEKLKLQSREMNVLLTDCPLSTKDHKMKIAERMFEKFKVKSLAIQNTAVLSLFSTGTTTGLVAECGEGVTLTVPVFEGYALPHAMYNIDVAGGDVTMKLIKELQDCDAKVTHEHYQFIQDIKETMCHVSHDYAEELN
jgi:actin